MAPKYRKAVLVKEEVGVSAGAQNENVLHSIGMLAATGAEGFTSRSLIVQSGDLNAS
jgi:hypothetical protein